MGGNSRISWWICSGTRPPPGAKAERKVEKALVDDLKRVHGKTGMLYRLAEASLDHPTGVVHEVIFPRQ